MEIDKVVYKVVQGYPNAGQLKKITTIYKSLFSDADINFFIKRLNDNPKTFLILAYKNEILIGFKIGYPYSSDTFYSWIGGVLPEYRNQKIATVLLNLMEDYAIKSEFKKLRTKSMNQFKPMMILNLKNGFDIVKVYTNTIGQTKIVFEKKLQ